MKRVMRFQLALLDNLIWVILLLFFAVNVFFTPHFLSYTNIVNIFYHSTILSMLVLGQGLVILTGNIDLSIESTLAFAPAVAMLLATKWLPGGLNPALAILVTLAAGAAVGLFNGVSVTKLGINSFIHTLSILIILRGLTLFFVPFAIFKLNKVYTYLGHARAFAGIPVAVIFSIATFFFFHLMLKNTPFGRFVLATGGNPRASYISGIDTDRMVISVFVFAGLLAAVAGLLAAGRQDAVNNTMGKDMVLLSFAGAILGGTTLSGGRGSALGMLGGALLLAMISNSLTLIGINVFLLYATYGILIFFAVLLDRVKVKLRDLLFHRENVKRLEELKREER